MKTFKEYFNYQPAIDGPALDPSTISGSEVQIRTLARNIRSSFVHLPNSPWIDFRDQILKACEILEQAVNIVGNNMDGELRGKKSTTFS
jgi:hypothetical protein